MKPLMPIAPSIFKRVPLALVVSWALLMNQSSVANTPSTEQLVHQHLPKAQVIGQGRMTYWGFQLYDAQLYSNRDQEGGFALSLQYLRKFEAQALAQQTMEELKKLGVSEAKRQEWSLQISKAFKTVKEGDTITAIRKSKEVTRLFHNGQPMSQIQGEELSEAFFGIWSHPKTSAPQLRSSLLGQACPTIHLKAYCHE